MKRQTILITAGPTIEAIDPVRYLSNHSSGKMGYALARTCIRAGHKVILISGPTQLKRPAHCHFIPVTTAKEMLKECLDHFESVDICFKVAAVADYRMSTIAKKKIKKTDQHLTLKLIKNPDILKRLGRLKKKHQTLVGFAAETHEGPKHALKKLKEKNLDWIALNVINKKNTGFGSALNEVTLIANDGQKIKVPKQTKDKVAQVILKTVLKIPLNSKNRFSFNQFKIISLLNIFKPSK